MPLLAQMGNSTVPCIPTPKKVIRRRLFGRNGRSAATVLRFTVPIPSNASAAAAAQATPPHPPAIEDPEMAPIPIPLVTASNDSGVFNDSMSTVSNATSQETGSQRSFDVVD